MKTFLEVEGKMGPIPQPTSHQYSPPQLDTNPKVRKDNAAEKRKRAVPTKKFKPSEAPKPGKATTQPPMTASKVPEAPENRPPPLEKAKTCESTPLPGARRMSRNLFEDGNWLLPPNYLNNDHKDAASPKSPIKEEPKTGEQSTSPNAEKCGWGPSCPFCKNQERRIGMANTKANFRRFHPCQKYRDPKQDTLKP